LRWRTSARPPHRRLRLRPRLPPYRTILAGGWRTPCYPDGSGGPPMSRKVLLVTGDGGNSFEALYAYQRFLEAQWEPVIAAPARRRLHLIQHDFEPGWQTYIERPGQPLDADVAITAVSARE